MWFLFHIDKYTTLNIEKIWVMIYRRHRAEIPPVPQYAVTNIYSQRNCIGSLHLKHTTPGSVGNFSDCRYSIKFLNFNDSLPPRAISLLSRLSEISTGTLGFVFTVTVSPFAGM